MNVALKYLTVLAALGGAFGCYRLHEWRGLVALVFFAGVLSDPAEIRDFIVSAGVSAIRAWKGQ